MNEHAGKHPTDDRIDELVRVALRPAAEDAARLARRALAAPSPRPYLRLVLLSACLVLAAVTALLVAHRPRPAAPGAPRLGGEATITATGSLVSSTGPDGAIHLRSIGATRPSRGVVLIVMKGGAS
jgi:hypothetical protein